MNKDEIIAALKEALSRELLQVEQLAHSNTDDFIDMLFSIQRDFEVLADRCNVMGQDFLTAETERQVEG